ncbi:jg2108, partial [Pararge aegeria aegeria]
MPLNNAEKCKNYRKRKKEATLKIKKATLTSAERSRMYRLRKKQLAQGIQSSVNEVMYTPSTSNSRMTFEPLPQPVTTKELLHQAHKQSVNTDCLIVPKKEISEELSDNILHVNTEAPLEFNVQLVKPIKTELILSENMVQLREQGSTRVEAIQNPHLSIQHNLPKMR